MEAAKLLFEKQVSGLLVVDADNQLIGLLSEKDLYSVLYPEYQDFYQNPESFLDFEAMESKVASVKDWPVSKIMTRTIHSVSENDPLMKVGAIMLSKRVNRLPVISETGNLIGIVSRRDIYHAILREEFKL